MTALLAALWLSTAGGVEAACLSGGGGLAVALGDLGLVAAKDDVRLVDGDEVAVTMAAARATERARRLAPPAGVVPRLKGALLLASDAELGQWLVQGTSLWRCPPAAKCRREARLSGPALSAVRGPGAWLLAVAGQTPALVRVTAGASPTVFALARGEVLALCDLGGGEAWVLVREARELTLVAASTATPAIRRDSVPQALAQAYLDGPPAHATPVIALLARAAADPWPELERLGLYAARDGRAGVRVAAATALARLATSRALSALWLLSRDPVLDVREAVLEGAREVCAGETANRCKGLAVWLVADPAPELAFGARDLLLDAAPGAALRAAPLTYKLEAVSGLISRMNRQGRPAAREALELLARDPDERVRAAALAALAGVLPQ